MHRALKNLLSEQEAHDALVFLAATLVILPIVPNHALGPFHAFNPRKIWELVVLVMTVGAASYIALRTLGSRLGLALAGFVGGFISASATIGLMGNRAKRNPEFGSAAASSAIFATVATVVQMFLVLLAQNKRCDMPRPYNAATLRRSSSDRIRSRFYYAYFKDSDNQSARCQEERSISDWPSFSQ